jgi:hypothetical protein
VVLAKFARCTFNGEVRPGDTLRYDTKIIQAKDTGASVSVSADVGERRHAEAEIFFARLDPNVSQRTKDRQLFDPAHLLHWLRLVGVFDVGVRQDGTRLRPKDYGFPAATQ